MTRCAFSRYEQVATPTKIVRFAVSFGEICFAQLELGVEIANLRVE